jgi:hypothetical protein
VQDEQLFLSIDLGHEIAVTAGARIPPSGVWNVGDQSDTIGVM